MKISRGRLPLSHVPVILCIDRFGLTVCQRLFVCANAYSRGRTKGHANVVVWGGVGGGGRGAAFVRCGAFAFPSRKSLTLPALSLSLSLSLARARAHTLARTCVSVIPRANARLPTESRTKSRGNARELRSSARACCLLSTPHLPPSFSLAHSVFVEYPCVLSIARVCTRGLFLTNVGIVVRG